MAANVKATPKLALLVIDMQEHFRDMGAAIVPELNSTIKECRVKHIPVIFTQHGHKHVELDSGVLGKFWGHGNMIQYKSQDWKLLPELCIDEKDVIIDEKRRYDAFFGTILEEMLHQLGVDTVVISGVMTNICCETTARSAFVRDFDVIFLSDGTATSSESMHDATLKNIAYGFGKVMTCAEFRDRIQ